MLCKILFWFLCLFLVSGSQYLFLLTTSNIWWWCGWWWRRWGYIAICLRTFEMHCCRVPGCLTVVTLSRYAAIYDRDRPSDSAPMRLHIFVNSFYLLDNGVSISFIRSYDGNYSQTPTRSHSLCVLVNLIRWIYCCQVGLRLHYVNVAIYILMRSAIHDSTRAWYNIRPV